MRRWILRSDDLSVAKRADMHARVAVAGCKCAQHHIRIAWTGSARWPRRRDFFRSEELAVRVLVSNFLVLVCCCMLTDF